VGVDEPMVGLADAIRSLRTELLAAMEEGEGQGLRFRVGPVELEFELAVTKEHGAGGGVRFWVISAESKLARSSATTHQIKLSLAPIVSGPEGEVEAMVADEVAGRPR
jgi:Trypsin-co-occurring domain 2